MIGTDKLASYQVAHRELLPSVTHRRSKYLNNRAENSTSVDQGPGTGDETLRPAWAGPTVAVCVRQHPTALSAPSSSDRRARMANRDDQPLHGLDRDYYRRSGLKDAVSHYLLPASPLTSTAPQAFPNNLTMPCRAAPCLFAHATQTRSRRPTTVVMARQGRPQRSTAFFGPACMRHSVYGIFSRTAGATWYQYAPLHRQGRIRRLSWRRLVHHDRTC